MTNGPISAGERFSTSATLSAEEVARFARLVGDSNPLHYGTGIPARGFTSPIASGPHTSSLLMALAARHFSTVGPMVGLSFSFLFKAPVPVGAPLAIEWLVIRVRQTSSGDASIVDLRGRVRTTTGTTAVGARGLVLVWGARAASSREGRVPA